MMLLEHQAGQDKQRVQVGDAWEDQDGRVFTIDTGAPLFSDSVTQWFSNFIAQLERFSEVRRKRRRGRGMQSKDDNAAMRFPDR